MKIPPALAMEKIFPEAAEKITEIRFDLDDFLKAL
jgi:hypothetical protein